MRERTDRHAEGARLGGRRHPLAARRPSGHGPPIRAESEAGVAVLGALDLVAIGWFLGLWILHGALAEFLPTRRHSLSWSMDRQRETWIARMAERDLRMIDTAIMQGLQNGTAFFASTSLLAIGGGFALLNASDRVVEVVSDLNLLPTTARSVYEVKVIGLIGIYAYAFFKFGWAYRLFNYASVLIGAVPMRGTADDATMAEAVRKASSMTVIAGRHFNRGLRAFFIAVGYLGWFIGPWPLIVSATLVFLVLLRRQFLSDSRAALLGDTVP
jgi:uncharacterized membrane protein